MGLNHQQIGESATDAVEQCARASSVIAGAGVSAGAMSRHTPDTSVGDVLHRCMAGLTAMAQLRTIDEAHVLLIAHRLAPISMAIENISVQLNGIVDSLEPFHEAQSMDQNGHLNLQLTHASRGSQTYDLGSPLNQINANSGVLLDNLPYIAQIQGESSAPVLTRVLATATDVLSQSKNANTKLAKIVESGTSLVEGLKKTSDEAQGFSASAKEQLAQVTATRSSVDANAADVEQKAARARELSKDADTLQQRVTGFSAQFEAFETQMKSRLEQFTEFEKSTLEAQRINGERDTKIGELIEQADTMIRGATTAGLSQSLEETKALYEARLEKTQRYFLISVAFLLICSLPIAAQLVPGPWQQYFTQSTTGSDSTLWLSAIGKLLLVIPGTWATAFFASNYSELFHLSREYAHKAALAKAIDGFKREAPEYAEELVASVFMEIRDNPGSRKAPSAATPQNPVTEKFFEKVLESIQSIRGGKVAKEGTKD